jgi:hypothetical protein
MIMIKIQLSGLLLLVILLEGKVLLPMDSSISASVPSQSDERYCLGGASKGESAVEWMV